MIRVGIDTSSHPNAEIARRLWQATAKGEAEIIRSLLAPDVAWHTRSSGDLSGSIQGPDAVIDLLARSGELVESLRSDLIDIFVSDHGAVLYYRVSADRGPASIETEMVLQLRIRADVVVHATAVPVQSSEADSFWRAQ